jgi:peptidoglycan/LPS O-acetylase OafA/YrhL
MYIIPPHRFTVYAMGIGLGYILRKFNEIKFTQSQLKIGWYLSTASLLLAFFGPAPMGDIDYKYNATHAAHYAAFAPIAWCIFFGWIILVSQMGHTSELIGKNVGNDLIDSYCDSTDRFTEMLEWKGFLVCTKVSYGLYLTQFPVFFYNVGRVRTPIHYGFIPTIVSHLLFCF